MNKHLSRQQFIRLAKERTHVRHEHLEACNECRLAYDLLLQFFSGSRTALASAPAGLIEKAAMIVRPDKGSFVERIVGKLVFDSWLTPAAGTVRGVSMNRRRLRFETDTLKLDVMAVKETRHWSFTAKLVNTDQQKSLVPRIKINRTIVQVDESGFYMWQSATPPSRLTVLTDSRQVSFENIAWRTPRL